MSFSLRATCAAYQASNVTASATRKVSDSWNARLAVTRVADAFARLRDDSVPHLAAE
jgi:hypothetical protein